MYANLLRVSFGEIGSGKYLCQLGAQLPLNHRDINSSISHEYASC